MIGNSPHPPIHWSERSEWIEAPQQERSQRALRALLQAAAKLFTRDGFEATTIAGIAEEAGVTVASLYRRFADKNAVFRAVVDLWSRSLTADSDRMWASVDWSERTARDMLQFHIDLIFSAYEADQGLLLEIDRRSSTDAELAAIVAGMERHGANSLYERLSVGSTPEQKAALREKTEIATWMLKVSISSLMVREKQGHWPFFTLTNSAFERAMTQMVMSLFEQESKRGKRRAESDAREREQMTA